LTLDFGFVIQGNTEDELPEQLLGAVRVHRLDLENCPLYPGDDGNDAATSSDKDTEKNSNDDGFATASSSVNEDDFWDCNSGKNASSETCQN
jgi:hypothetical protein